MFYLSAQPNGRQHDMSLHKTYRVECNGTQLAARLKRLGTEVPRFNWDEHTDLSEPAPETQKARALATRAGWVRQTRYMPLFHDRLDGLRTEIKYDLCPGCVKQIAPLTYPGE